MSHEPAEKQMPHGYPDRKPDTIQEAIDILNAVLTEDQKHDIANCRETDLIQYHFSLGLWIRNNFGLWQGNSRLLEELGAYHADDASFTLIEKYRASIQNSRDSES